MPESTAVRRAGECAVFFVDSHQMENVLLFVGYPPRPDDLSYPEMHILASAPDLGKLMAHVVSQRKVFGEPKTTHSTHVLTSMRWTVWVIALPGDGVCDVALQDAEHKLCSESLKQLWLQELEEESEPPTVQREA